MSLLVALGVTTKDVAMLFLVLGAAVATEFLKITYGRLYRYRDASGFWIVRDRKTGQEYIEGKDGHLNPINSKDN